MHQCNRMADAATPPTAITPDTKQAVTEVQHDKDVLDEALTASFSASDSVALTPVTGVSEKDLAGEAIQHSLDEAVALTFPASDPVAVAISISPA